jgi:hypothetical protein
VLTLSTSIIDLATTFLGLILGALVLGAILAGIFGKRGGGGGSLNRYMVPPDLTKAMDLIEPRCVVRDLEVDAEGRFELRAEGDHGPIVIRAYRGGGLTIAASAPEHARLRCGASYSITPGAVKMPRDEIKFVAPILEILERAMASALAERGLVNRAEGDGEFSIRIDATFERSVRVLESSSAETTAQARFVEESGGPMGQSSATLTITDRGSVIWRGVLLDERARALKASTAELTDRARRDLQYAVALLPVEG